MGFALAVLTAMLIAAVDVITRRVFEGDEVAGPGEVAALRFLLAAPLLLAMLPVAGPPPVSREFWWVVAVGAPLEVLALVLYMTALRAGTLAETLPLQALTPALLLVTAPLVAGDAWAPRGLGGVLLVVSGAWLVLLRGPTGGVLGPIKALRTERGPRAMLAVAVLYSVTSALGKRGVGLVGVYPMAVYYFLATALVLLVFLLRRPRRLLGLIARHRVAALAIALIFGVHLLTHMAALARLSTAEMIALKRLALLFAPAAGMVFLGERPPPWRIAGACLMTAGAVWIGLSGRAGP